MKKIIYAGIAVIVLLMAGGVSKFSFDEGKRAATNMDGKLIELKSEALRECYQTIIEDYTITLEKIREVRKRCSDDVDRNCLLVITEGEMPTKGAWGGESRLFPIRILDVNKQQIIGYKHSNWNYWVNCRTEYYNWASD